MVNTLLDIVSEEKEYIEERLGDNLLGLLLYGSYSYQNMHTETKTFSDTTTLFDKKPDYIAIVKDPYIALRSLIKPDDASVDTMKKRDRLLGFPSSPLYVNDETDELYPLITQQGVTQHPLPYKIGFLSQEDFHKSVEEDVSVIYHQLRLSKPMNIISIMPEYTDQFHAQLDTIRTRIFDEALVDANDPTDRDELIYLYANTYRFELYRIFDNLSVGREKTKKVGRILDATFFEMQDKRYGSSTRDIISDFVIERLQTSVDNNKKSKASYYPSVSSNPFKWDGNYETTRSMLPYTVACARCSVRNAFSNALFGSQSNMSYLARKLGFLTDQNRKKEN